MQKIPVLASGKKKDSTVLLESSEIYRIERLTGQDLSVHTFRGKYRLNLSMEIAAEWLEPEGFQLLNNSNLINLNQIQDYDEATGLVYFGVSGNSDSPVFRVSPDDHVVRRLMERKTASRHALNPSQQELDYTLSFQQKSVLLAKRPDFFNRVRQAITSANRNGEAMAVLYVNLDRFRMINQSLGFEIGDLILSHISAQLGGSMSSFRAIGHFFGDEVIFLLEQAMSRDEVIRFAKTILMDVQMPFRYNHLDLVMTASIGISFYPNDGKTAEDLLVHASTAMQLAKEKGGNGFQMYQPGLQRMGQLGLQMESELRNALEQDEFTLHYQPIVNLANGRMSGMEALVRWMHPTKGILAPNEFVPLAEETGLIQDLGRLVLEKACAQTKMWQEETGKPLHVSVNISSLQLQQSGFAAFIPTVLEKTGLDPLHLSLEMNEKQTFRNAAQTNETINRLLQQGIRIAIDDFGTGHSLLGSLKRFQIHQLKIDKTFITGIAKDPQNAAIVHAVIQLTRQLNIRSLAEGVETQREYEFVKALGCDDIQGNFYSAPLSVEDFSEWLKREKTVKSK